MNLVDVKVGETYNVRVKVVEKYSNCVDAIFAEYDTIEGIHIPQRRLSILHPISSEAVSEHDATRTLRKGDIVSPAIWQGREPWGKGKDGSYRRANTCWKCTVVEDEKGGYVKCKAVTGWEFLICACFLKLKVAIEEAKPFYVERDDTDGCYFVMRDDYDGNVDTIVQAFYFLTEDYNAHYYTEEQAKKLANEACNRLNAEYRKEQSND